MLDKFTMAPLAKIIAPAAKALAKRGVRADQVTIAGFGFGLVCLFAITQGYFALAAVALLLNRLADGLDGAVARLETPTKAGGFLDICLDFVFYAGFVLAFALYDPSSNALLGAVLLFCYMGTASAFLAFAATAEPSQRTDLPHKSFYFLEGLAEGTETVIFMGLAVLFPTHFASLAAIYALMCAITAVTRIIGGYRALLLKG